MDTRATIRRLARVKADQTNSKFPTDEECNLLIDAWAKRVWSKLIRDGWKPAFETISITATGATKYLTEVNIALIHNVYRVEGTQRIPLKRIQPENRGDAISLGTGPAIWYDLWGGVVTGDGSATVRVEFFPRPTSGTYEIEIVERFDGFSGDDGVWYGPQSSGELIALGAAYDMLLKEGDRDMAAVRKGDYTELYAQVCEDAGIFDAKHPGTVRDVNYTDDRIANGFDWTAREGWY